MKPAPTVLVILDGASEPIEAEEPTSLERASTPVLDALAQLGTLHRLATTPPELPAGSETGCALLLGWHPPGPVDRARLEAAARGIAVGDDDVAWRIDVLSARGERLEADAAARIAGAVGADGARVHHLAGHRLLLIGAPHAVSEAAAAIKQAAPAVHRWPAGVQPAAGVLDARTVVIGAPGAVTGLATLLGARTRSPEGITGRPGEPLSALADAALAELHGGEAERILVHVGGPDEAAHARDDRGKVDELEAADEELLLPLTAALHEAGGRLEVAIDHGCDPRTGQHDGAPTPFLRWDAVPTDDAAEDERAADPDEPGASSGLDPEDLPLMAVPKRRATATARTGRRLTERWAQPLPVEDPLAIVTRPAPRPSRAEGDR